MQSGVIMNMNMNFVVRAGPAERPVFNENRLRGAGQGRSLCGSDTVNEFQTSLMPFFNQLLGTRLQFSRRRAFPRRVFEYKSPIELQLFNQRKRLTKIVFGLSGKSNND